VDIPRTIMHKRMQFNAYIYIYIYIYMLAFYTFRNILRFKHLNNTVRLGRMPYITPSVECERVRTASVEY